MLIVQTHHFGTMSIHGAHCIGAHMNYGYCLTIMGRQFICAAGRIKLTKYAQAGCVRPRHLFEGHECKFE